MYIEPNTSVKLLTGVPLSAGYAHTFWFDNKAQQESYFSTKVYYYFDNYTYNRVTKGVIRVQAQAENLYNCNYMMFQNSSYGTKWFYAFINSIEYVNNITTEIKFEIDVMQTWLFDYQLKECFVEREHTATDNIGDNTVPENLEMGEYVADSAEMTGLLDSSEIVVAATFDSNYEDYSGGWWGGIYSGLYFKNFPNTPSGAREASDFIHGAGAKQDGIVAVLYMKSFTFKPIGPAVATFWKTKHYGSLCGYTPKNKKLYTFPYNFLYVTNFQGNGAAYHYEDWSTGDCQFGLLSDIACNPTIILAPHYYKGVTVNYDEKMVLSGFPQLAWNVDTFRAWVAQNGASLGVNALSNALGVGLNHARAMSVKKETASKAIAGPQTAVSLFNIVANTALQVYEHAILPDQARGGAGPTTAASAGLMDFGFYTKHIKPEYMRKIDEFFQMFGYAVNEVKVPNRNVRPRWTYTKTVGCFIEGDVPADDERKICQIYDNGVTFWKDKTAVGQYQLNNAPTIVREGGEESEQTLQE